MIKGRRFYPKKKDSIVIHTDVGVMTITNWRKMSINYYGSVEVDSEEADGFKFNNFAYYEALPLDVESDVTNQAYYSVYEKYYDEAKVYIDVMTEDGLQDILREDFGDNGYRVEVLY